MHPEIQAAHDLYHCLTESLSVTLLYLQVNIQCFMNDFIALVSGASKGIGLAISRRLIAEGYTVIMLDIIFDDDFESSNLGSKAHPIAADISNETDVQRVFDFVKKEFGRLDLLVNNAGIIRDNLIQHMPTEDFDKVIDVNLKGTWLMCKYAATLFKEQQMGRIVNITSRAWLGNRGQSNYAASKAGVVALTRVLALELGKYNVCVNAIAPGLIDTPLTQKLRPDVLDSLIQAQPTKSIGKPEDIAQAVVFLGSYATNFITGQTLYVDGGKSIGSNM